MPPVGGQIGGPLAAAYLGFSGVGLLYAGGPSVPFEHSLYIAAAAPLIVTRRRWQSPIAVGAMSAVSGWLVLRIVLAAFGIRLR